MAAMNSEYAHLRVLLTNTSKILKESQEASKTASAPKAASVAAHAKEAAKPAAKPAAGGLPKHATKAQQAMIVKQLQAEEDKLAENLKDIKAMQKQDKAQAKDQKKLEGMMKGKDKDMFESFDAFNKRANAKAAIGAMDVMSKLKKMIHFVKKGALTGDEKASKSLEAVLKDMTGMVGF